MIGELVFEIIVFAIAVLLYIASTKIRIINPIPVMRPSWWPQIILAIMIVVDLVLVWGTLRQIGVRSEGGKKSPSNGVWVWLLGQVINIALFIFLQNILGFLISSFIFALISSFIIDGRIRRIHPLVSLIIAFSLTLFFGSFLGMALPRGVGFLREISFWLY